MSRRSRAKHLIGSKVIRGLDREAVNLRTNDCIEVSLRHDDSIGESSWLYILVLASGQLLGGQRPARLWPAASCKSASNIPILLSIAGVTCLV